MTGYRQRVLWSAAIVSGLLHLLMIWNGHRASIGVSIHSKRPEALLEVRMLAPPMPSVAIAPKAFSRQQQRHIAPVAQATRSVEPEPVSTPLDKEESTRPAQAPTRSADEIIEAAKRGIRTIDRDLRQAFPTRPELQPKASASLSSKLERGIAAAGLPKGTTTQEMLLADGRRITKVLTSSGVYCVLGRRPGAGIAENDLAAFVTTTCPN
jgi:hypothetical protein